MDWGSIVEAGGLASISAVINLVVENDEDEGNEMKKSK